MHFPPESSESRCAFIICDPRDSKKTMRAWWFFFFLIVSFPVKTTTLWADSPLSLSQSGFIANYIQLTSPSCLQAGFFNITILFIMLKYTLLF